MTGTRARKLALALFVLAGVAGCSHTAVVGSNRTLRLAISEYRLNPARVRVRAGSLTIFVHNVGRLTHNLVIGSGTHKEAGTTTIWPGQSTQLTVELAPGTYSMSSNLQSDQALGVEGTLQVTR